MAWRGRLVSAGLLLLGASVAGAVASIAARWPAQFGGPGDPRRVAVELLSRGTAAAPPLFLLVLFAAAVALVGRDDRLGTVGHVGMLVACVVFAIGSLGEYLSPYTGQVPRPVLATVAVVGTVLSAATFAVGVAALRERRQT